MVWEYWLTDAGFAAIKPLLPEVYSGARRKDDRRIISGIMSIGAQTGPPIGVQKGPPFDS
jgi:transposase